MTTDKRARLVVLVDGRPLSEADAKAIWNEFSRHMEEREGDLAGFAKLKGWQSVRPEPRQGKAVLVAVSGKPARAEAKDSVAYVALMRGINVGGKKKVRMADLTGMFQQAGCEQVRTYIQSGNVVFCASSTVAAKVGERVRRSLLETLGFDAPVVLFDRTEIERVLVDNPFLKRGDPIETLHVAFFSDAPDAKRVAALDPQRSPPDEIVVSGRHAYLSCPRGYGQTKLTNDYLDRALGVVSTVRNWKTEAKESKRPSPRRPTGEPPAPTSTFQPRRKTGHSGVCST